MKFSMANKEPAPFGFFHGQVVQSLVNQNHYIIKNIGEFLELGLMPSNDMAYCYVTRLAYRANRWIVLPPRLINEGRSNWKS